MKEIQVVEIQESASNHQEQLQPIDEEINDKPVFIHAPEAPVWDMSMDYFADWASIVKTKTAGKILTQKHF